MPDEFMTVLFIVLAALVLLGLFVLFARWLDSQRPSKQQIESSAPTAKGPPTPRTSWDRGLPPKAVPTRRATDARSSGAVASSDGQTSLLDPANPIGLTSPISPLNPLGIHGALGAGAPSTSYDSSATTPGTSHGSSGSGSSDFGSSSGSSIGSSISSSDMGGSSTF